MGAASQHGCRGGGEEIDGSTAFRDACKIVKSSSQTHMMASLGTIVPLPRFPPMVTMVTGKAPRVAWSFTDGGKGGRAVRGDSQGYLANKYGADRVLKHQIRQKL